MNKEQINTALLDKMQKEQDVYRSWLLAQPPEEILNHTLEYSTREDILMAMEFLDLSEKQAAALLASPSPLMDVYKDFRNMNTEHMEEIQSCIEDRAEQLLEVQREKTRSIPLYRENARYAREHNEIDLFQSSQKATIACRDAIDAAIREGFAGMHVSEDAAKGVLAEFGPERVSHVLAAAVLDRLSDERISDANKIWAKSVSMFSSGNRHYDYGINSHSVKLDDFVMLTRKELEAAKERQPQKRSVKEQLTAKSAPGGKPRDKHRDSGAR